jgi:hypothetical protein
MTDVNYWQMYVAQNPDTPARTVDGSAIVITPHDSMLHTLNETATFIWDRADGSRTLAHITEELIGEFDVELALARTEALAFVATAIEKGLMLASPTPGEGGA